MKRTSLTILIFVAAFFFAAPGVAAQNVPGSNTTVVRRTIDTLMALENQANEAWSKGDSKFFDGLLSDKFVAREGSRRLDKAAVIKMIAEDKCDLKSFNLDDEWLVKVDPVTYVLSYRATWNGT